MDELKPCPFCGGKVSIALCGTRKESYWEVTRAAEGNICKCRVFMESELFERKNKTAAKICRSQLISAWNRRAAPENKPLTLKELPCFEPIYVVPLGSSVGEWSAHWCIYQIDNATAKSDTHKGRMWFLYDTDYSKTWLAYRRPPEGIK